jgi:dienelactone hydrolase
VRRALGPIFASALLFSACSGSHEQATVGRASPSTSTTPPPTSTTVPDIVEVPRPARVADETFKWFAHPAANGAQVLLGVKRNSEPGPHSAILLVTASGGLNVDYVSFAEQLSDRGFDVAVGCWFASSGVLDPENLMIPCASAPLFKGVVDDAVPDLGSLVEATQHALGASTRLALVGFSRGAGIAALRASAGHSEPVVLVSGMYEGWNGIGSTVPGGEANVVDRVDGWRAPVLILHGTNDGAVPVVQAYDLEAALRGAGVDVESHYYEGSGHNLAGEPGAGADLQNRIAEFLCARLGCPGG